MAKSTVRPRVLPWVLAFLAPVVVEAATFEVTRFEDGRDGVCDAHCTLREAVDAANQEPGRDTVRVPAGTYTVLNSTVPYPEEAIEVRDDLELVGAGSDATLIVADQYSFGIDPDEAGSEVEIREISFEGLVNRGDLDLVDVHVTRWHIENHGMLSMVDSSITDGYGGGIGGGFLNHAGGIARIERSRIADCLSGSAGASAYAGGIANRGEMTIRESVIEGNRSVYGGGILNEGGEMVIFDSVVRGNKVGAIISYGATAGRGAGILNERDSVMWLERVTVADNLAGDPSQTFSYDSPGAGGISNGGSLKMVNVTVSGNESLFRRDDEGFWGGPGGLSSGGTLSMTNVTFAANRSGEGADALGLGGEVSATNVLVQGACELRDGVRMVSGGGNLEAPGSGCGFDHPSDQVEVRFPGLLGLDANGGVGGTHALVSWSPARGGGNAEACPETDQRGIARFGEYCDIGSFQYDPEVDSPPEPPPVPEPPSPPPTPEPPVIPEPVGPEPAPPSAPRGGGSSGCAVGAGPQAGGLVLVGPVLAFAAVLRRKRIQEPTARKPG